MRIAVIGAGISGLGCAYALRDAHQLTVYEADARLGGHTNTVDVTLDGQSYPVDTGFLVYNERTYPNLIALFEDLKVPTAKSDMSFAVSLPLPNGRRLEWSGTDLSTVFGQRRNLVSPGFLSMLWDVLRFNRAATRMATASAAELTTTLGEFLDQHHYGQAFRRWYLLPMAAAIWSCPMRTMLDYPAATFIRFCHNHGLLQVTNRPQWWTVQGGARQYVQKIAALLPDIRCGEPVLEVRRDAHGSAWVRTARGNESYDQVVLACHSDQSLGLLADADEDERRILSAVAYQPNHAILHTDIALMPQRRSLWSAWNYMSAGGDEPEVSVSYLLNKLQPLPFATPLLVSLNPITAPRADSVIAKFDYMHPVFDARAIKAHRELPAIQGRRNVWLAGAWTGYGFHEDGLKSGLAVAKALQARSGRSIEALAA